MKSGLEAAWQNLIAARASLGAEIHSAVDAVKDEPACRCLKTQLRLWSSADKLSDEILQSLLSAIHTSSPPPSLPAVFTPETLAERWGCSAKHVRNLIRAGILQSFSLGTKLVRISRQAVIDYEALNG